MSSAIEQAHLTGTLPTYTPDAEAFGRFMPDLHATATPTAPFGLEPGSLVIAGYAHPDDEFMHGNALEAFRQNGIDVIAIVATDGEKSDRGGPDSNDKRRQRRDEAMMALEAYGVAKAEFLSLPDAHLSEEPIYEALVERVGNVVDDHAVDMFLSLGETGLDGHLDHISVHRAMLEIARDHSVTDPFAKFVGLAATEHVRADYRVSGDATIKFGRIGIHKSQFPGVDLSDPGYIPAPGSVEQPGVRLDAESRRQLQRYHSNMLVEHYTQFI